MKDPSEICLNCGKCCSDSNLMLVLFPQDALLLASTGFGDILFVEDYEDEDSEIQMHTRITGDCVFFDKSTKGIFKVSALA